VKVTLHLADGQTMKDLLREVAELTGQPVKSVQGVSGRNGVLVDGQTAHQYLARRFAPPAPPPAPDPLPPVPPAIQGVEVQQPQKAAPRKAAPRKKATPTADPNTEV
jgi:hypothetical protein